MASCLELLSRAFPRLTRLRPRIEDATYYRTTQLDSSPEEIAAVVLRPILEAGAKFQGPWDLTVFFETAMFDVIVEKN